MARQIAGANAARFAAAGLSDAIAPEHHLAPRQRMRAKLLRDDEHRYVAAWLDEQRVWRTLTARDSIIYRENDFEVFLDPDGTRSCSTSSGSTPSARCST